MNKNEESVQNKYKEVNKGIMEYLADKYEVIQSYE